MDREIKGVIFDLDGVLCFTDRYHYQAWRELADRLGIYFDEKINDRLRGISRMDSLEIILEKSDRQYTLEEKTAFTEEKNARYQELLQQMNEKDMTDEVRQTLTELRQRGYRLAIGSSSKNTQFIIRQIGAVSYFDAVADGNDITRSKPDPEVFLKAAEKLGIAPEQCVVVEDAASGIRAAKAGNMTAYALGGDAQHSAEKDVNLLTFSDLINYL